MKTSQVMFAALLLAATTASVSAQSFFPGFGRFTAAHKVLIERNYTAAMNSENRGLVESALEMAAMLKLDYPLQDFPYLRAKIEELKSASSAIFADPAMFTQLSARTYKDANEFFSVASKETTPSTLSVY